MHRVYVYLQLTFGSLIFISIESTTLGRHLLAFSIVLYHHYVSDMHNAIIKAYVQNKVWEVFCIKLHFTLILKPLQITTDYLKLHFLNR